MNAINRRKKIVNGTLSLLFVLFAIVQLNDPDGILWFSIYLMVAFICLISVFKRIPSYILWIIFGGLLVYSAFHFTLFIDYLGRDHKEEIFGKMVYEKPYLEGSREFLGLLIAAAGVWYQLKGKKK